MAISDLMILVGDNSNVQAPSGFKRMDQDLNQGAGGKFIYLAYKDTTSGPFIVDITFVVGDSSSVSTPAGYTRLEDDLNRGAGGKFIYLCFLRGEGIPITDLGLGSTDRPLNTLVRPRFADLLVPRSMGPTVTPDALWKAGKRLIVLVDSWIFADLSGEREVIWNEADDGRGIAGMVMKGELDAEGTGKLSNLKEAMNRIISRTYEEKDRLQLLGCCLTPDDSSIVAGVASAWFEPVTAPVLSFWNKLTGQNGSTSTGPKSLHEACAMPATPAATRWLRNEWQNETVNIVSTDFFQMSQTVDLCIQRNRRPARVYLRSPLNGFVIDLPGGSTQAGTRPIMYPRNSPQSTNQQWILTSSGHIRSASNPDMVLDIEGAKTQPGTAVILWTEHKPAQPNQQWDFDAEGRLEARARHQRRQSGAGGAAHRVAGRSNGQPQSDLLPSRGVNCSGGSRIMDRHERELGARAARHRGGRHAARLRCGDAARGGAAVLDPAS